METSVQRLFPAEAVVGRADVRAVICCRECQTAANGDSLNGRVGVGVERIVVELAAGGMVEDAQRAGAGGILHGAPVEREVTEALRGEDVEVAVRPGRAFGI